MAYTKQGFKNGDTLSAEQLEAMEDGILSATPVRGTDYWTEADKTEMVNDVIAALPSAEGGSF